MDTTAPEQVAPANARIPRWRRMFRLRIGSFLIAIAVIGVLLGGRHAAHRQREIVAEIERAGGQVRYNFVGSESDLGAQSRIPAWLIRIFGADLFRNVVALRVIPPPTNNLQSPPPGSRPEDLLRWIAAFPRLKSLTLGRQCTDDVLEAIGRLPDLEVLTINGSPAGVTEAGIAHLKGLKNLQILSTSHQGMTDASLEILGGLSRLEILHFQRDRVTHEGIAQLRRLRNLRIAMVRGPTTLVLAGPKADPTHDRAALQSPQMLNLSDDPGLLDAFPPAGAPKPATGPRASPR